MDPLSRIRNLDGQEVVAVTESAWGPTGRVRVADAEVSGGSIVFDLLVPTAANDIWDYIWDSEKAARSTEKVQIFQNSERIPGSVVTSIRREGQDKRWDAIGPEQYRIRFGIPIGAIATNAPVEVRFFWQNKLMSTAGMA